MSSEGAFLKKWTPLPDIPAEEKESLLGILSAGARFQKLAI
jgi:hypothetical protein